MQINSNNVFAMAHCANQVRVQSRRGQLLVSWVGNGNSEFSAGVGTSVSCQVDAVDFATFQATMKDRCRRLLGAVASLSIRTHNVSKSLNDVIQFPCNFARTRL